MVYPALLPLIRTPRLPVVDWTDAPADLNGLVRFTERRNLVSARVPSHFNWPLPTVHFGWNVAKRYSHYGCENRLNILARRLNNGSFYFVGTEIVRKWASGCNFLLRNTRAYRLHIYVSVWSPTLWDPSLSRHLFVMWRGPVNVGRKLNVLNNLYNIQDYTAVLWSVTVGSFVMGTDVSVRPTASIICHSASKSLCSVGCAVKSCHHFTFCPPSRPSVRPHGTTRLPLDGFSWNLVLQYFVKIVPGFIKIWQ